MAEAGFTHHVFELRLRRVHANRFGQVAVALAVARHPLADARQHVERIPVVSARQRLGDLREFQHQQPAAGLEHAVHLGQRTVLVGHVAQAESDADEVDRGGGEWQRLGVAQRRRKFQPLVEQPVAAFAQHGFIDVGVQHGAARADLSGEGARQVAGAARDVEHAVARTQVRHRHGVGLPGAVQTHRHQIVHQVVVRRHRIEHAAHALRLL